MSLLPRRHKLTAWLIVSAMLLTVAPVPAGAVQEYYQYAAKWGDRQAADGKLYAPTAVVVDSSDNVYVLDSGNDRVQKFDAAGNFIAKWGTTGSGNGQFKGPKGMTIDGSNNIYVADTGNDRVQKFNSSGDYLGRSNGDGGTMTGPQGVAYDGGNIYVVNGDDAIFKLNDSLGYQARAGTNGGPGTEGDNWLQFQSAGQVYANGGKVFVADTGNNRVQKLTGALASDSPAGWYATDTTNTSTAYAPFSDPLSSPMGIAARGGVAWVADSDHHRILKFDYYTGAYLGIAVGSFGTGNDQFSGPTGMFIDAAQNVYVADTYNNRVQKFTSNGEYLMRFGTGLGTNETNFSAKDVAVMSDGNVYVTSSSRSRVEKFDSSGTLLGFWGQLGSSAGNFNGPSGVAVDSTDTVYVADTNNNRIQKFNDTGSFQGEWGTSGSGNGQFSYPEGVAVGPDHSVYVADTNNHRIQKFTSGGAYVTQWGTQGSADSQFQYPKDVAVDASGNVYVADRHNARVQKFDSNGTFLAQIGGPGSGDGQFSQPWAVAVTPDGTIVVADGTANRLQEFDASGNFMTKWASAGSADGQLSFPSGVTVDTSGRVFVADTDNRRVQRFDPLGDVTAPTGTVTIAGGATYSTTANVALTLSASDYSGVTQMRYAESLGALAAAPYITYAGSADLTLTGGDGLRTVYAQFKDGSGSQNESAVVSDSIILDTSAPSVVGNLTDEGAATASTTTLRADWTAASDSHSGIAAYEYSIGTSAGATDTVDWLDNGTSLSVTKTGLSLSDGTTYYINVRAKNGAGLYGAVISSDGITVDSAAPTVPVVTDDGSYTTTATEFHAVWTESTSTSGIAEYQYAVGTSPGATDTVDWTSTGLATTVTIAGLSLSDGQAYYVRVRAKNGVGTLGAAGISDGIVVDASAPSAPGVVTDDGAYTTNTSQLHATWTAATDAHSGIAAYEYSIGTSAGATNIVGWTDNATSLSVTKTGLSLADGQAYFINVRAKNGAGLYGSVSSSDGILVDKTGPTASISAPAYSSDLRKDAYVELSWSALDPGGSGVASYELQYQDMTTSHPVFKVWRSGLTGTSVLFPTRTGKTYRFRVRAKDNAGNFGPVSSYKTTRVPYDDREATSRVGFNGAYINTASNYYLGTIRYSRRAGEKISMTATTKRFVLIGTAGNRSRAKIYIDGRFIKEIDPRSVTGYAYRRQLFNYRWSSVGRHTITVENLATRGRPQFDVDGVAAER